MRKPSIQDLVLQRCVTRQKPGDATTFYQHVQRNLVPEVRVEVQNFFGSLDELEAQYPGLDYTCPSHIYRLSRYPHHRRLFKVFSDLGLTKSEIHTMCQWEGTKAAREKFIKETGQEIPDLSAEGMDNCERWEAPRAIFHHYANDTMGTPDPKGEFGHVSTMLKYGNLREFVQTRDQYMQARSRGGSRRERGSASLETDFDEWLKDASERQELERLEQQQECMEDLIHPPVTHTHNPNSANLAAPEAVRLPSDPLVSSLTASLSRAREELVSMFENLQNGPGRLDRDFVSNTVSPTRSRHTTARS